MASHGTNARYREGCREACCRAAHSRTMKEWKLDTARNGKRLVPSQVTARQLQELRKVGWSTPKVGAELGYWYKHLQSIATGHWPCVTRPLADAVQRLWEDVCAPLEKDMRRWPIEPFKAAVIARYGSLRALGNTNQARQIHKHAQLRTDTAERYADSLGLHPTEIWGVEWYHDLAD